MTTENRNTKFVKRQHTNPDGSVVDILFAMIGDEVVQPYFHSASVTFGNGVELHENVSLVGADIVIGNDVLLQDCRIIGPGSIGDDCQVIGETHRPYTLDSGFRVGARSVIRGNLLPNTRIGEKAVVTGTVRGRIGNRTQVSAPLIQDIRYVLEIGNDNVVNIPPQNKVNTLKRMPELYIADFAEVYLGQLGGNVVIHGGTQLGWAKGDAYGRCDLDKVVVPANISLPVQLTLDETSLFFRPGGYSVVVDAGGNCSVFRGGSMDSEAVMLMKAIALTAYAQQAKKMTVINELRTRLNTLRKKLYGLFSEFKDELEDGPTVE